ncbi:hypothetical protein E1A91_A13G056700v1 [Gossypium mustelinum]|uniref:Uncharacterized protein n=1 Tax=Gossypium mustelinum TaxID=34275 RepID=A0A5D2WEN7_GOSMU|nr:hypothetical protein E1A91_A13G056700v1 [Gossypium mustelinum]
MAAYVLCSSCLRSLLESKPNNPEPTAEELTLFACPSVENPGEPFPYSLIVIIKHPRKL